MKFVIQEFPQASNACLGARFAGVDREVGTCMPEYVPYQNQVAPV